MYPSNEELYKEYLRLRTELGLSSHPGRTTLLGWDLEYPTSAALLVFLDYIIFRRMNDFYADTPAPVILDCGANIGTTVLHYRRLYPEAKITAFEPDPVVLPFLQANLARNGASNVELVEAAAWVADGESPWLTGSSDGNRIVPEAVSSEKRTPENRITVRTVDLRHYLEREVDLLKLDIEGAEFQVVPHIAHSLSHVKNIVVEVHITSQADFLGLAEMLRVLSAAGFKLALNSYGPWRDLVRRHQAVFPYSEQYLLLVGWRSESPALSREETLLPYCGLDFVQGCAQLQQEKTELEQALTRERETTQHERAEVVMKMRADQEKHEVEIARWQDMAVSLLRADGRWKKAELVPPFPSEGGYGWVAVLPALGIAADSADAPFQSTIVLCEDGKILQPPHVEHEEIRKSGLGRYSHWGTSLYFSASDNSDPNTNGKSYTVLWQVGE